MRECVFHFKEFECSHGRSAIKIGVDAVLIGAWADISNCTQILDVGTGCGVIALMCAQRNNVSKIEGIDIDTESIEEAILNFANSKWHSRLKATLEDFNSISNNNYDLIISNPPFFKSGIEMPNSARLAARHEFGLSPIRILEHGKQLLNAKGRIAMILPKDRFIDVNMRAHEMGYLLQRALFVRGNPNVASKRVMVEYGLNGSDLDINKIETITLEYSPGRPTLEHITLCRDFYLKF